MKKTLLSCMIAFSFASKASDNWQTIETDNFKIHFPKAYQAWATSSAHQLESVRERVKEQQNRVLEKQIEVVVFDPYNQSNGFAVSSSTNPMMALYATPPQSDTVIANSSSWQQLLILHEYIHLVHLAQPTRNQWQQKLRHVSSAYDILYNPTPRWAAEGYATLLESQMTGRGRLHDNYVESLILQFAREGNLPRYNQLSEQSGGYLAGSMAYLMGVRFMQWLEDNFGKAKLDAVWTRMQAVEKRDFNRAFEGVYRQKPVKLYRRFVAEYHHQALTLEQQQPELQSSLWFDLGYIQTAPSLSPDESKLAIVSRNKRGNTSLTLYATEENNKASEDFDKAQARILEIDPLDIADTKPLVFKKETKKALNSIDRKGILNPVWQDNETLVFGAFSTANDEMKTRHQDLFSWNSVTGEVKQLTEFANIRRFSLANVNTAYAERVKYGYSQLVKVDLSTGEVSEVTPATLEAVYDFPKVKNDRLAYLKTELNHNWSLLVRDLNTAQEFAVPMPKDYQFLSYPEWSEDGQSIYYVAGVNGQTNLYQYTFATDALEQLSFGQQVIQYPMPSNHNGLLYMAVNSEGPDIYQLTETSKVSLVTERAGSSIASTDKAEQYILPPAQIKQQPIGKQTPYIPQKQSVSIGVSGQYNSASTALFNLGIKGKDILNKLSWQLGGAFDSKNAVNGLYAESKFQRDKWQFLAHIFDYKINAQNQYQFSDVLAFNESSKGAYFKLSYPYIKDMLSLDTHLAYAYKDINKQTQQWFALGIKQHWQRDWQKFAIGQTASARFYQGDNSDSSWHGYDAQLGLFGKVWSLPLYANYRLKQREDLNLNIGGFASSLIKSEAQGDRALIKELPFYTSLSDDYQSYEAGLALSEGAPWLYYVQHQLDHQDFVKSYGIKLENNFDFKLAPSVFNDIKYDFGIVKVEGETIQDELRAWLGVWYSL